MAKPAKQVSDFDSTKSKAEGENFVEGEAPGSSIQQDGFYFEGLGYLEDFEDKFLPSDSEGTGDWFVVKVDGMTGAHAQPYTKGDVRRLSHFVNGINDDGTIPNKTKVASGLKRLLSLNAIRLATKEEINEALYNNGKVSEMLPDSADLAVEREKRIRAEQELEGLRARLGMAETVRASMSVPTSDQPELGGTGDRKIEKDDWDLEEDKK